MGAVIACTMRQFKVQRRSLLVGAYDVDVDLIEAHGRAPLPQREGIG